jgi:AraC-like DNA-binding protein
MYADKLCVHVNHLNRVIKSVTGKTTSEIIAGKMIEEAKRLLCTTELSIGEIGDILGFEEIASFSKFFRKHTGYCPKFFRIECKNEMVA